MRKRVSVGSPAEEPVCFFLVYVGRKEGHDLRSAAYSTLHYYADVCSYCKTYFAENVNRFISF